jgi:hypothetical protein
VWVVDQFNCGGARHWNADRSKRILCMARDHWVEHLVCRRCRKIGFAELSMEDKLSWNVQVDSVSEGFKLIQSANGGNFYCSSCDRAVEL